MLPTCAVKSKRLQCHGRIDAVVKNTAAAANHGVVLLMTVRRRLPRKSEARSETRMAGDVALGLVAQADAECQVGASSPVILSEHPHVGLHDFGQRISADNRKLRGTAAQSLNLCRAQAFHLKEQCAPVSFER